jgi:hypothetical protein
MHSSLVGRKLLRMSQMKMVRRETNQNGGGYTFCLIPSDFYLQTHLSPKEESH